MAALQTIFEVQRVGEIATLGANLEHKMTPLDLVSFLRSSYAACEGSDASEAAVKGALGFISKLMTSARSDGEDFMFSAAEREKAEVSYGTLAWIVFASDSCACFQRPPLSPAKICVEKSFKNTSKSQT